MATNQQVIFVDSPLDHCKNQSKENIYPATKDYNSSLPRTQVLNTVK